MKFSLVLLLVIKCANAYITFKGTRGIKKLSQTAFSLEIPADSEVLRFSVHQNTNPRQDTQSVNIESSDDGVFTAESDMAKEFTDENWNEAFVFYVDPAKFDDKVVIKAVIRANSGRRVQTLSIRKDKNQKGEPTATEQSSTDTSTTTSLSLSSSVSSPSSSSSVISSTSSSSSSVPSSTSSSSVPSSSCTSATTSTTTTTTTSIVTSTKTTTSIVTSTTTAPISSSTTNAPPASSTSTNGPVPTNSGNSNVYVGDIKAVVFLVTWAQYKNEYSQDSVKKILFNGANSFSNNIENFYDTCSYGKASFKEENVAIVNVVIKESSGVYQHNSKLSFPWSNQKCGSSEQSFVTRESEKVAQELALTDPKLRGILFDKDGKPTRNRRSLILLPKGYKACGWGGIAGVGCTGTVCTSMVRSPIKLPVIAHELQHSSGLSHASRGRDDYGDYSDVMGLTTTAAMQCHNVAYSWRLGWTELAHDLNVGSFTNGQSIKLTIPSAANSKNGVKINLGGNVAFFLGYRVKGRSSRDYDGGMDSYYSRMLSIHSYNGSQANRDYTKSSLHLVAKAQSKPWTSPSGSEGAFTVSFLSGDENGAQVEIQWIK